MENLELKNYLVKKGEVTRIVQDWSLEHLLKRYTGWEISESPIEVPLEDLTNYKTHIKFGIRKLSGKKFKNGSLFEMILDVDYHPITKKPCYVTSQSGVVECKMCEAFEIYF